MCVCSPKTLVGVDELPRFNGKRIESIYAEYENSRYGRGKDNGYYVADVLFYKCYIHDWDIDKDKNWNKVGKRYFQVKVLPKEFDGLFGKVENKGKKIFVTSLWFRLSDSANGSFTDQTLDLGGWSSGGQNSSFSLYRDIDFVNNDEHPYAISEGSELANKFLKIFKGKFQVEEVEFIDCGFKAKEGTLDFATKYPYKHTPIRYIDGMVYPDEKLSSWRWHYGMPYRVQNGKDSSKYEDRDNIRVWDADLNRHLYLQRTKEVEVGETGLIMVDFPYKQHDIYGSEGNAYCHIRRYNESCNYVFETYTVTKILKTKEQNCVEFTSYRGLDVMRRGLRASHTSFYRIMKIADSDHKEKK